MNGAASVPRGWGEEPNPSGSDGSLGVVRVRPVGRRAWRCFGCIVLKVVEDGLDNGRVFDAGDDLDRPVAVLTGLDVDVEDALQALGPAHGGLTLGGHFVRCLLAALPRLAGVTAPARRYRARTPRGTG